MGGTGVAYRPSASVSNFINLSRWVAALLVAGGHTRQLILMDYSKLEHPSWGWKIFYFFTQLGHEAVMVFFIISGYLIGGTAIMKQRANISFDAKDYAVHRAARIYTAYLPAVLLFGGLDLLGSYLFSGTGLYGSELHISSMGRPANDALGLLAFLGNLAMLQTVLVPTLGTNGPLWSLACEWWYYCIFGAAMLAVADRRPVVRAFALGTAGLLCVLLPLEIVAWGLIWLLGAGIAVYGNSSRPKPGFWLTIPSAAAVIVVSRLSHTRTFGHQLADARFLVDLAIALAYGLVLLSMHRVDRPHPSARLNERLAGFSYSLYLIHFPLMVFIVAFASTLLGVDFLRSPTAGGLLYILAVLTILCLVAFAFATTFEEQTQRVRGLLRGFPRRRGMDLASAG